MSRRTIVPQRNGHIIVSWDAENDAVLRPLIEKMLAAQMRFFILEGDGLKTEALAVEPILASRKVMVDNADLQALVDSGVLSVSRVQVEGDVPNTGEIAKTADDVLENDTLVTSAPKGG